MRVELASRELNTDEDKCTGCALCAVACPTNALDVVDRKARLARPDDCMACQLCETECPYGAIRVEKAILRIGERVQERSVRERPIIRRVE